MHVAGDEENTTEPVVAFFRARCDVPPLEPGSKERIGAGLRAMYTELKGQPLPDRFLELIDRLDRKARGGIHEG
jgi:hypothetical protein